LIAELEAVALEAWPPRDRIDFDGWVLCESGGFTRRTNSVHPLVAGRLPLGDKVNYCEAFYAERGARTVFKLTDVSEPAVLDEVLAERGYEKSEPTSVQTLALEPDWFAADAAVRIRPAFRMAWLRDCAALWGLGARDTDSLREILVRISAHPEPCGFAWLSDAGSTLAVALGVVRSGHVFLGEIATRDDVRRQGLGARITESLLHWGAEQGAKAAMLQVVADNEPGLGLYRRFGFQERYRYWYREGEWAGG
jgi:ribosomal protein S18 acetylase RimI-like enzyme